MKAATDLAARKQSVSRGPASNVLPLYFFRYTLAPDNLTSLFTPTVTAKLLRKITGEEATIN
jgi:hypothetical protein